MLSVAFLFPSFWKPPRLGAAFLLLTLAGSIRGSKGAAGPGSGQILAAGQARPPKLFAGPGVFQPYSPPSLLRFLQQLFASGARARATSAGAWQPYALTPAQQTRHRAWVAEKVYRNWLGPYYKAYHLRKGGAGGNRGLRVLLLREPGRQGGLFFYDPSIGPGNFRHLFEHLGERVRTLGYHQACADQCTRQHRHHAENTLKQLFKPRPADCPDSGHCNQRYGLITIDLVSVNGQPMFIRVAANPVREPGFTPAAPFEELLRAVFDEPPADAAIAARIKEYAKL